MRTTLLLALSLASSITASDLVHEDFSGAALPKSWTPGGRPGSWSVVDGALQGDCNPTDDHGPSISTPLAAANVSVSFKLTHEALMLIDRGRAADRRIRCAWGGEEGGERGRKGSERRRGEEEKKEGKKRKQQNQRRKSEE